VIRLLSLLLRPYEVVELCLVETVHQVRQTHPRLLAQGYFDNPASLIETVAAYDGKADLYLSLNPVKYQLLRLADNQLRSSMGWSMSANSDVARRTGLLMQFKSLDNSLSAVLRADSCQNILRPHGWPEPMLAESGDNIHLLYALDLPNDARASELVKNLLATLAVQLSDETVRVASEMFNASLFYRMYGTLVSRSDGEWQRAVIMKSPDCLVPVTGNQLEALLAKRTPLTAVNPKIKMPVVEPPIIPKPGPDRSPAQMEDAVTQFVAEQCELDRAAWVATSALYALYETLCELCERHPLSIEHFARQLAERFGLIPKRRKVNGKVIRGFDGIRLREEK
jgi:hypothetical protein